MIQIREDTKLAEQEHRCFARAAKACGVVLDRINVCHQDLKTNRIFKEYSYIIIGGSAFSVRDRFRQKNEINKLILKAVSFNKPLLGICFGFQLMIEALGGKVVKTAKTKEFSTKLLSVAKDAEKEKIFFKIPNRFYAQEAHKWAASKIPEKSVLIIKGAKVLYQGIKIEGKPVFGFQFHPELSRKDMLERMRYYNSKPGGAYKFLSSDFKRLKASKSSEKIIVNFFREF